MLKFGTPQVNTSGMAQADLDTARTELGANNGFDWSSAQLTGQGLAGWNCYFTSHLNNLAGAGHASLTLVKADTSEVELFSGSKGRNIVDITSGNQIPAYEDVDLVGGKFVIELSGKFAGQVDIMPDNGQSQVAYYLTGNGTVVIEIPIEQA